MRTIFSPSVGVSVWGVALTETPLWIETPLWTEIPLDRVPPSGQRPPHLEGTWDQAARQEVASYRHEQND